MKIVVSMHIMIAHVHVLAISSDHILIVLTAIPVISPMCLQRI